MYRISVYDDTNPDFEFVKTSNIEGPYYEMRLPYDIVMDVPWADRLPETIGNHIVDFIKEAESEKDKDLAKHLFVIYPICEEMTNREYKIHGFSSIEQDCPYDCHRGYDTDLICI